ncbi:carboxymuconolactone decarboxylase family protein [Streptomyces verrucosisporus]|uniref:carboxymuconolactone decarboxylase family protein n=1 Tax=Streptomyces verrucosisporus TaxID=1695161 RepID=UPI0019D0B098|nr:carboxymuconolactone decarboxylase family protein [Streptomyces verrucosisporus]MBN3933095.1 carboxymuconolactone decarboxylase family protein [Streptomyces verrucosisporus]
MRTRTIVRAALRGSLRDIRHVGAVPPGRARGLVARVYAQAERDFGVVAPPLALHSGAPRVLAASWLLLRETLLVEGRVSRAAKEAVAVEVSRANSCPYCVDVHQAALETSPRPAPGSPGCDAAEWIRFGAGRGERAPFTAEESPEIIGVALTFHYLNRMVAVFLDESPVPARTPAAARGPILRTVARAMRPAAGPPRPGEGSGLLPPAPPGPRWAGTGPVADAVGRATAAVDDAARWVPPQVRRLLESRLAAWDGSPPGLGRIWLEETLAGSLRPPAEDLPTARIALLTAFAPYQVTEADVAAFRERHPGDRKLVELTAWASLTTAVLLASRLAGAPARTHGQES